MADKRLFEVRTKGGQVHVIEAEHIVRNDETIALCIGETGAGVQGAPGPRDVARFPISDVESVIDMVSGESDS